MRHPKLSFLWIVLLLMACVLAGTSVIGCSQDSVTDPTPIEQPPAPPDGSGGKALDGAVGGDVTQVS